MSTPALKGVACPQNARAASPSVPGASGLAIRVARFQAYGAAPTITTAIALETSKGEFAQGIALGLVLVALALLVNIGMAWLQGAGGFRR